MRCDAMRLTATVADRFHLWIHNNATVCRRWALPSAAGNTDARTSCTSVDFVAQRQTCCFILIGYSSSQRIASHRSVVKSAIVVRWSFCRQLEHGILFMLFLAAAMILDGRSRPRALYNCLPGRLRFGEGVGWGVCGPPWCERDLASCHVVMKLLGMIHRRPLLRQSPLHHVCVPLDVRVRSARSPPSSAGRTLPACLIAASTRLARSPPTKANRAQYPAGSPDSRKWESCRTMPLVGGFSRGYPASPAPSGAAPYSLQSPSSALKTSLLRAAQISALAQYTTFCININIVVGADPLSRLVITLKKIIGNLRIYQQATDELWEPGLAGDCRTAPGEIRQARGPTSTPASHSYCREGLHEVDDTATESSAVSIKSFLACPDSSSRQVTTNGGGAHVEMTTIRRACWPRNRPTSSNPPCWRYHVEVTTCSSCGMWRGPRHVEGKHVHCRTASDTSGNSIVARPDVHRKSVLVGCDGGCTKIAVVPHVSVPVVEIAVSRECRFTSSQYNASKMRNYCAMLQKPLRELTSKSEICWPLRLYVLYTEQLLVYNAPCSGMGHTHSVRNGAAACRLDGISSTTFSYSSCSTQSLNDSCERIVSRLPPRWKSLMGQSYTSSYTTFNFTLKQNHFCHSRVRILPPCRLAVECKQLLCFAREGNCGIGNGSVGTTNIHTNTPRLLGPVHTCEHSPRRRTCAPGLRNPVISNTLLFSSATNHLYPAVGISEARDNYVVKEELDASCMETIAEGDNGGEEGTIITVL
ncbi:hypothetical protein PR048_024164 [Dryococelus australis]|uniref:Uncharacterized protein n=1 Tax=Dryococelus australis TaxID=614101 RepID=A0ABQ9GW68_9NEOP|nr:hypothetical protein PR048_024164 [Dryococelus australis]